MLKNTRFLSIKYIFGMCLVYMFASCGIDEVFYLDAPSITYNVPTYETTDYTAKYVAFQTEEDQDDGGDYTFDGTAVYYKIYNNYSTMVSRNSAIASVNTSSNSDAAAIKVIETYGYKELGSRSASGGTLGSPLISDGGSNRSVYIRLTTYGNYASWTSTAFTPATTGAFLPMFLCGVAIQNHLILAEVLLMVLMNRLPQFRRAAMMMWFMAHFLRKILGTLTCTLLRWGMIIRLANIIVLCFIWAQFRLFRV